MTLQTGMIVKCVRRAKEINPLYWNGVNLFVAWHTKHATICLSSHCTNRICADDPFSPPVRRTMCPYRRLSLLQFSFPPIMKNVGPWKEQFFPLLQLVQFGLHIPTLSNGSEWLAILQFAHRTANSSPSALQPGWWRHRDCQPTKVHGTTIQKTLSEHCN